MKINSNNDSKKMCFLFFNENKSPNLGKHCKTKTRNEAKDNFLNFDFNNFHQGSPFNNGLRTKQKQLNYLNLNQNDNYLPINDDQNNFGSFLNKLQNSNTLKNGPNINIIVIPPNCNINKIKSEKKNKNINPVNNNSFKEQNKDKKKGMFNFNYHQEKEKKCEKEKIDSPKNDNIQNLFDSNFNLIEENCGKDDVSEILKEFANLNLKSSFKEKSNCNNNPKICNNKGALVNDFNDSNSSKDKEKKSTNTGDSVNIYTNSGNESDKKEKRFYNMSNPYAKDKYKK